MAGRSHADHAEVLATATLWRAPRLHAALNSNDYRTIPFIPQEHGVHHRAKNLNHSNTGAALPSPPEAPQASQPPI